ncbi:MAG: hypothetical protein EOM54_10435 [Clostridia bacterium]|nr:hypothetical protein [Clostridia bacterium]
MPGTAAKGTVFKIGATNVAQLTSVDGIKLSADSIEVTDLGNTTGYREFTGGFKDGGEVALTGYFGYTGEGQQLLYAAFESGAATSCSIEFPAAVGAKWEFNGVAIGYDTGAELEDAVSFDCTIKVSGKPILTAVT